MLKSLFFGCFRPPFPSPPDLHRKSATRDVHPEPPTPSPSPTPAPSPTPVPSVVEGKPLPTTTPTLGTTEALQEKEAQLHKRCEMLESQMAQLGNQAKAYKLEGKTSNALLCIKKKKMLETSVTAVNNMITKVVEQQIAYGNADTLAETMQAISGAARATQNVMDGHRIDQVDIVMESIQDNEDHLREVNERLAEPIGALEGLDDDVLLAELEAELEKDGMLTEVEEADVLNNRRPEAPVLPEAETVNAALPNAPTHPVIIDTKTRNKSMTRQNLNLESA